MILSRVYRLIVKEFKLEFRNAFSISGILLYVFGTAYIFRSSFADMQGQVWNAVYWMLVLFASINALSKSFGSESNSAALYYFQLVSPMEILFSKVIYNFLLLTILYLASFGAMVFIAGNPVRDLGLFFLAIVLAGIGLSLSLTFIAGLIAKARSNSSLMSILVIPLVVPIILLLLKVSANALLLIQDSSVNQDLLILIAIDLLLISLVIWLFPSAWKD